MSISVIRTASGWWVDTSAGPSPVETSATTTTEPLADRAALEAVAGGTARPRQDRPQEQSCCRR